jgi:predicted peptidase
MAHLLMIALLLVTPAQSLPKETSGFLPKTFTSRSGQQMPYRIFVPHGYDSRKKYPLVLWLHGGGGRGTDNLRQISGGNTAGAGVWTKPENQEKYPSIVVAPQCPENEMWTTVDLAKPTRQLELVLELIASIQKTYSIDERRLYVAGQSMGGLGTWGLISEHPQMFAAAIPVCGGGNEQLAPKLVHVPIWAFHGEKDQAISVERSRRMIAAIRKAGGTPRYSEYKDVGHNSWERAFSEPDLLEWVFAQRRSERVD